MRDPNGKVVFSNKMVEFWSIASWFHKCDEESIGLAWEVVGIGDNYKWQ